MNRRDRIEVRGLVHHGPGRAPTVESLELDPPADGEVLIRMVAAGVCHSDLHVVDGHWRRPADVVLGHEGAGLVEALGPGVPERRPDAPIDGSGLRVGDLVALAWTAPCRMCLACRRGDAWLCLEPKGSGHRLHRSSTRLHRSDGTGVGAYSGVGAFCSAQVVAAEAAIPVDPRTPPEVAALIGCAASTGIGAVRNTAGVAKGASVVVLGLGGVGLSALLAAGDRGAQPLIGVDLEARKLDLAVELGASEALPPGALAKRAARLPGGGPDHVLECIGSRETVELAIRIVRPGGTVTLVGMPPMGEMASFDVYGLVEDAKRLLGSNYGSCVPARDFPAIAADAASGRLPLGRLIDTTIDLDDIDVAFEAIRRREGTRRVVRFPG